MLLTIGGGFLDGGQMESNVFCAIPFIAVAGHAPETFFNVESRILTSNILGKSVLLYKGFGCKPKCGSGGGPAFAIR